jgi:transcriptional regulator with XRE-family HTH domain
MTPGQCRAARAWLNWTQEDLAEKSGVSLSALKDFEAERRVTIAANRGAIRQALEAADIRFGLDFCGRWLVSYWAANTFLERF